MMGLDSYFKIQKLESPVIKDVQLCGGMFSGDGYDGSFRGKVYNEIVEYVTGVSLYQEEISAGTVQEMALDLATTPWSKIETAIQEHELGNGYKLNEEDYRDTVSTFVQAADQGCILVGWW